MMNKTFSFKGLQLAAVLLLCSSATWAYDFKTDGLYYNITSDSEVEVTCGGETDESGTPEYTGDMVLPETVEFAGVSYSVTAIGNNAFNYCTLTSVSIPESVTQIGEDAFGNCDGLTSIVIPDNVSAIGGRAFEYCEALQYVTLGSGVNEIGEFAFYACSNLVYIIALPVIPPSCDADAFRNVDTGEVSLFVDKGSAAEYAYTSPWSEFNVLPLPDVGDKILADGLYYTILTESEVEVTWGGIGSSSGTPEYTGEVVIPETAFYAGVTYDVVGIGNNAFSYCTLTSVSIPESVTYVGEFGFYYCESLASVELPSTVETVGYGAFGSCTAMQTATINCGMLGQWAFNRCNSLKSLSVDCASVGYAAFYSCTALESVTLSDNVETLDGMSFAYCSSLASMTIPAGVAELGEYVFEYCTALAEMVVAEDNPYFRSEGNVVFSKDMTTLVRYPAGSTATEYELPSSVTEVGVDAFCCAHNLTTLVLPEGLTSIGSYAFEECDALQSVTSLNPEPPKCDSYAFYDVPVGACTLYVPEGSYNAYASADTWRGFLVQEMEADAVGGIAADAEQAVAGYFTTDGMQVPTPQRGINIIRYADGTARKVLTR